MGNIYGYMRISTKEERELQRYERQQYALDKYAIDNHIEFLLIMKEDKSGKDFEHRTEWGKLERIVQPGDTIVFKDICRFTRQAEQGYKKYMELYDKGVELIFVDNMTISTPYIRQLLEVAKKQDLIARISLENTVKLLLLVELDRAEKEREIMVQRIKDGIQASKKKSGRPMGKLDKMTDELEKDIKKYLADRSIKQVDLIRKHNISRDTLKKYIKIVMSKQLKTEKEED